MSHEAGLWKRYLLLLYVGMWSIILAGASVWLTLFLIGTLGDPFEDKEAQTLDLDVFNSIVALTEKKVVRYLGEWEFLEPKLPGHFHHVGRWYQSDKWNFCVKCHGPTPHSRAPQQRAFLNMHNLFISCQVCHVREKEGIAPTRFGWIDITDGQLCPNPDMAKGVWGEYGAKIVPLKESQENPQPATLDEEEAFAAKFRTRMDKLDDRQKVIGNKFIHRRCVETPVRCSDCHNSEKEFLPYTALGYSSERSDFLVSAEVVDLVARYETFYIPNLLKTDEQTEEGTGDETK
jgi:hypothetical protein